MQADTSVALTSLSVHATGGAGSANPCMFPSELCCLLIACCVSVCSSMLYVCASSVCRVCVTTSSVYIERVCACIKCVSSVCVEHRVCIERVCRACIKCLCKLLPCANYSVCKLLCVVVTLSPRPFRIVLLLRSPCVMCEALGRMWYGQCT